MSDFSPCETCPWRLEIIAGVEQADEMTDRVSAIVANPPTELVDEVVADNEATLRGLEEGRKDCPGYNPGRVLVGWLADKIMGKGYVITSTSERHCNNPFLETPEYRELKERTFGYSLMDRAETYLQAQGQDPSRVRNTSFWEGFKRAPFTTKLVAGLGAFASALYLVAAAAEGPADQTEQTSPTTSIYPMSFNDSLDTKHIQPPYNSSSFGTSEQVVCSFVQDTKVDRLDIDEQNYVFSDKPEVFILKKGNNYANTGEIDNYGPQNIQVGWADGMEISTRGDVVTIKNAVNGADLPPANFYGPNSPNGSFDLPSGSIALGSFGLMDYGIEHLKNTFYLSVACDPQKTTQLLAHDNASNP